MNSITVLYKPHRCDYGVELGLTPLYIFLRLRPDMVVTPTDLEGDSDFVTVYWSMRSADNPLPALKS